MTLIPLKIVLISHSVPMSLYLAIEALKKFQKWKIERDHVMNFPEDSNEQMIENLKNMNKHLNKKNKKEEEKINPF